MPADYLKTMQRNLKRRMKVKPAGMSGMTGSRIKVKRMKAFGGGKKFGA